MKQFILRFRAGFPDALFAIEDVVSGDDRVAGRWTMRGTRKGEFSGIAATGRSVTRAVFSRRRIQDCRFAELWHLEDELAILWQLGSFPPPG